MRAGSSVGNHYTVSIHVTNPTTDDATTSDGAAPATAPRPGRRAPPNRAPQEPSCDSGRFGNASSPGRTPSTARPAHPRPSKPHPLRAGPGSSCPRSSWCSRSAGRAARMGPELEVPASPVPRPADTSDPRASRTEPDVAPRSGQVTEALAPAHRSSRPPGPAPHAADSPDSRASNGPDPQPGGHRSRSRHPLQSLFLWLRAFRQRGTRAKRQAPAPAKAPSSSQGLAAAGTRPPAANRVARVRTV